MGNTPTRYARLFGDETPGWGGFFRIVTFRLTLLYPFCVVFSNSATDILDLLLLVCWLLGGRWRERLQWIGRRPVLVVAAALVAVSFVGVLNYETDFFRSLKYWKGHQPLLMLIVLSTVLTTPGRRALMLSSLSTALLLGLSYSFVVRHAIPSEWGIRLKPAHIAKNTIWFGMAFTLLAGLWMFVPFSFRKIPRIRRLLSCRARRALRRAATLSWGHLVKTAVLGPREAPSVYLLSAFRLGILLCCFAAVFWYIPSRTAYVALPVGMFAALMLNDRKGRLIAVVVVLVVLVLGVQTTSPVFQWKLERSDREIERFERHILGHQKDEDERNEIEQIKEEIKTGRIAVDAEIASLRSAVAELAELKATLAEQKKEFEEKKKAVVLEPVDVKASKSGGEETLAPRRRNLTKRERLLREERKLFSKEQSVIRKEHRIIAREKKILRSEKSLLKKEQRVVAMEAEALRYRGGRLNLYWRAAAEIMQHPWGLGMEKARLKCREFSNISRVDNTHNEFLAYGLHSGVIGLLLFTFWIVLLFRQALQSAAPQKQWAFYVVLVLTIDCLFNCALSHNQEGHLFVVLIALMLPGMRRVRPNAPSTG